MTVFFVVCAIFVVMYGSYVIMTRFVKLADRSQRRASQKIHEEFLRRYAAEHDPSLPEYQQLRACKNALAAAQSASARLSEETRADLVYSRELLKNCMINGEFVDQYQHAAHRALQEITWGKLEKQYGRVYDSLSSSQQSLVNYPELSFDKVFHTPNGEAHHSVDYCYSFDRSDVVLSCSLSDALEKGLRPCSKCVAPHSRFYPPRNS